MGKLWDSIFNICWDSKIICGIPKKSAKKLAGGICKFTLLGWTYIKILHFAFFYKKKEDDVVSGFWLLHFSIFCRCILEVFHRNFTKNLTFRSFLSKRCGPFPPGRKNVTHHQIYLKLEFWKCNTQIFLTTSFFFFREKSQNARFLAYFWQTLGGTEMLKFWKCNTQILLSTSLFFWRKKAKL